ARPSNRRSRFVLRLAIVPEQDRLCEFYVPIAVDIPHQHIHLVCGFIEFVIPKLPLYHTRSSCDFAYNPPIKRLHGCSGIETRERRASVHLGEAASIPKLGREVAVTLDTAGGELDIAALRRHCCQREAQCIGAEIVDQM